MELVCGNVSEDRATGKRMVCQTRCPHTPNIIAGRGKYTSTPPSQKLQNEFGSGFSQGETEDAGGLASLIHLSLVQLYNSLEPQRLLQRCGSLLNWLL